MAVAAAQIDGRPSRFLELRALQSLTHLRFAARQRIEGAYSGRHLSRQRGGSAEFVDYREYAPGEDLRRIDWKVLGRTGRPYVRLYQDETNLRCTLMIDASSSMLFAGRDQRPATSKLEYVQYLSTAFSYLIAAQHDQVGLAIAADGLVELVPPGGTSGHVWRLQKMIESIQAIPRTNLAAALRQAFDRLTGRGVIMIMSDFLVDDVNELYPMLRLFRARRWEVIALHIIHPDEEHLPQGRAFRFEGMENDGRVDCSPAQVREAYESAFSAHVAAVRGAVVMSGSDYHRVSTATPWLRTLMGFLVERQG
ncbi:MAG TPA: DUF58 domain-containing protein [Tepidisphaeraceae bacterium]|nr:DUF58 domain-containing protein [Tepidisphaeraceae bacterium]